jgi:hypothetical protein
MQKRTLSLLSLLGMLLIVSFSAKSQSCTSCTYNSTGGNASYNLSSGQTLCITSGTYTGTINAGANVTICISPGAIFKPSSFHNFKSGSILNNHGTVDLSSIILDGGTFNNYGYYKVSNSDFKSLTINNYGQLITSSVTFANSCSVNNYNFLEFSGNVNFNNTRWINHPNAYAHYVNSFTINSGTTYTNQGFQEFDNGFTVSDNNTFANLGRLHAKTLSSQGYFTNGGTVVVREGVTISNNGRTTNNCRFVVGGQFQNTSPNGFENNSLLWITGTNQFQNSGNITNTGYLRTGSYIASGTVNNTGGEIVVTGSSISSGTLTGGSFSDLGNASNGYKFDSQSGTMTASTGYIALKDTSDMGASSCSFVSLPVRIVDFNATQLNAQSVQLKWTVADEANIHSYVIEQLTGSNSTWKAIGSIWPSAQAGEKQYSYTDKIAMQGKVQYRLKVVENDGTIAYSAIKSLQPASIATTAISLYPNPVEGQLTVSGIGTDAHITLFGTDGMQILATLRVTGTIAQIDMASLKAGVYLVKIQQQGVVTYHKVVKR